MFLQQYYDICVYTHMYIHHNVRTISSDQIIVNRCLFCGDRPAQGRDWTVHAFADVGCIISCIGDGTHTDNSSIVKR